MSDDDSHVTRRELALELRSLESRLTLKIILAVVAAGPVGAVFSPVVGAAIAAAGITGLVVFKTVVLGFLHSRG